jgi:hypothetical protein
MLQLLAMDGIWVMWDIAIDIHLLCAHLPTLIGNLSILQVRGLLMTWPSSTKKPPNASFHPGQSSN